MKTKRRIRASFSEADNSLDISLPKAWPELSQQELRDVYFAMSIFPADEFLLMMFLRLGGLTVVRHGARDDGYRCLVTCRDSKGKSRRVTLYLTPEVCLTACDALRWLLDPGGEPVRLDIVGNAHAVDAKLHGVNFRHYYMLENYYQGYIKSQDVRAIAAMERLLYPDIKQMVEPDEVRVLNIVNWMVQVKMMFSTLFPNFFRPAGGDAEDPNMLEVMNNQIRALTGGDVTKEETINNIDCWRALTELDFKAKEAEEFRRQMSKTSK